MRATLSAFMFLFLVSSAFAQTPAETKIDADDSKPKVFTVVEEPASYPGGQAAIQKFVDSNLQNPYESFKGLASAKVFVGFAVNPDGSLSDFMSYMKIDPLLEAEAIRVVSLMPKWIPAKKEGKVQRVNFVLPVNFIFPSVKPETILNKQPKKN